MTPPAVVSSGRLASPSPFPPGQPHSPTEMPGGDLKESDAPKPKKEPKTEVKEEEMEEIPVLQSPSPISPTAPMPCQTQEDPYLPHPEAASQQTEGAAMSQPSAAPTQQNVTAGIAPAQAEPIRVLDSQEVGKSPPRKEARHA